MLVSRVREERRLPLTTPVLLPLEGVDLACARQDVPRTADHAASRTFYTWRVDGAAVRAQLGAELLAAACNLRARFRHECAQHWEARAPAKNNALYTAYMTHIQWKKPCTTSCACAGWATSLDGADL